jgi:SAM-dependent methyltransferase
MRNVGEESRKTYQEKINSGFFNKYMSGRGAEIGYAGYIRNVVPILDTTDGYDLSTPGYDGKTIPVPDEFYDYVYSSHTLEHIENYKQTINEWMRVVKPGGYIITVVPHRDLYEKKLTLPSNFNGDHKRFYSPSSLLKEFEDSLPINSFRVRHLKDNDEGHDYTQHPEQHSIGHYEIELVIQKLRVVK